MMTRTISPNESGRSSRSHTTASATTTPRTRIRYLPSHRPNPPVLRPRSARPRRTVRSSQKTPSKYGDLAKTHQQSTFGAHFVEVGVDTATAEIRVRRMLAVCAAGRILNPKSARSQVIGAMTMGVGAALMEALAVDKRAGFFVNP